MSEWVLVPNPGYEGKKPTLMEAQCHDKTPFITLECGCGQEMHLHESQIAEIHLDVEIVTTCEGCGGFLAFEPGWFQMAFKEMRDRGWIA